MAFVTAFSWSAVLPRMTATHFKLRCMCTNKSQTLNRLVISRRFFSGFSFLPRTNQYSTTRRPSIAKRHSVRCDAVEAPAVPKELDRTPVDWEALSNELPGVAIIRDPSICEKKSKDYYWYSPILKQQLDDKVADFAVEPRSSEEVLQVVRACSKLRIPITVRGRGTGNYGQAVPVEGGCLMDMSKLSKIIWVRDGVARAEAGMQLNELEEETVKQGWELRFFPSTRRTASVGGFVAGGSGGVGSITYGGLRDTGNVLGCRIITMEETPREIELRGPDVIKAIHAYGTNGIITEVELALAPALKWHEMIIGFKDFMQATAFARKIAEADGVVKRLLTVVDEQIVSKYLVQLGVPSGAHYVLALVHEGSGSKDLVQQLAQDCGGSVERSRPADDHAKAKGLPLYEFSWNHTTLHALKYNKNVTYLQSYFDPSTLEDRVQHMIEHFGSEVLMHLEFVRSAGRVVAFGIQIVEFSTAERLAEIIQYHEENGVPIFNPHTYILEDGGMKQVDEDQLMFKVENDPYGLLNPRKMRAWDERFGRGCIAPFPNPLSNNGANGSSVADVDVEVEVDAAEFSEGIPTAGTEHPGVWLGEADPTPPPPPTPSGVRSRRWEELTTKQFADYDMSKVIAIVPVAAIEQHGPHLPVGVDALINEGILSRAVDLLPKDIEVVVLPPLPIGKSNEHSAFPGTLTLSAETIIRLWTEVSECAYCAGIRKIVFFNTHGGQPQIMDIVSRDLRVRLNMLAVCCSSFRQWNTKGLFVPEEEKFGIHGGGIETSMMLHLRPELVNMQLADDFRSSALDLLPKHKWLMPHSTIAFGWMTQDLNASGAVGNALDSDAERGQKIVDQAAQDFVVLLQEIYAFPMDALKEYNPDSSS